MDKMHISMVGVIVVLVIFILAMAFPNGLCRITGISEKFWNMIDDDCDGMVDEDYVATQCGNGIVEFNELCDDGNKKNLDLCSNDCKPVTEDTIFVSPYMGNIDGDFSEEWYYVYDRIVNFHDKNGIPSGFSIFPGSIHPGEFGKVFRKMYNSPNIQFVQKAYKGTEREDHFDLMSFDEQREIIKNGQDYFREEAAKILGISPSEVRVPVAYNQPQGRFNNDTREALRSLGFQIFFEMYVNDDLGPIDSTADFDVLQYGEGFTKDGMPGRETVFQTPDEMIRFIKAYDRTDVNMLYIGNNKLVPIWCHHSDFESKVNNNQVDEEKWMIYTITMLRLKMDPDIVLVSPSEIWEMRHN